MKILIILRFDLDLKTLQVTVRAIRFYKTDYIMCAIRCPYKDRGIGCFSSDPQPSSFMLFPAKFVDDTTCECDLKHMSKVNRPMPYDLTVLLEPLSSTSIPGFVQSVVSYRNMLHMCMIILHCKFEKISQLVYKFFYVSLLLFLNS